MKNLLFCGIILFISACNTSQQSSLRSSKSYLGLDMGGQARSCKENPNLICYSSFGPGEQFAEDCLASGNKAIACDCHDYICIIPDLRTGVDINGAQRSCSPASIELICTNEHTIEDQFAEDCRDAGFESVKCGCHDYICVK
jgi:hypothetical protein